MNKFHIPYDLIQFDGESQLHEKVNKDIKFSKYLQAMLGLMDENIKDKKLKDHIAEACQLVYIFAEIAAYKEGFHEGIIFLVNFLASGEIAGELFKRDQDFAVAFKEFLTEYKLDRNIFIKDYEFCKTKNSLWDIMKSQLNIKTGAGSNADKRSYER